MNENDSSEESVSSPKDERKVQTVNGNVIGDVSVETQTPLAETSRHLNPFQRFFGVFAAPKATLADIAAKPTWIVPFVIVVIAAMIFTKLLTPAIIADVEASGQLEKMIERQNISAEQAENLRDLQRSRIESFGLVGSGIGVILLNVVGAAILLFVGNLILAGKASYKQVFAIYVWSGLIALVSLIIRAPISLQQMTMKVYFSPAVLFPPEAEKSLLFKIAAGLDLFTLWRVAVLAVGFSAVYRFTLKKSLTTLGALYALVIIISALFAGIFGA